MQDEHKHNRKIKLVMKYITTIPTDQARSDHVAAHRENIK